MEATFFIEHDVYVVPADDRVFIYAGGKGRDTLHKYTDNPPHSGWQSIPDEIHRTIPFPADWKVLVLPDQRAGIKALLLHCRQNGATIAMQDGKDTVTIPPTAVKHDA